ncbi:ATP-dependent DNA helicase PIF1-like isoform X2 [Papaver somniferum]|nr:ATP-dependent DNA helicase PIF1-like isoform X2 [Papaver somniferum]XP_026386120.1 ATP-dependent DNA helicase PIF1-like isoform X2 [Papaver somniferum]
MKNEFEGLRRNLNEEHTRVFEAVMRSVEDSKGGLFFVYGSGGTGKTYLWRTIITALRAQSKIVLAVASSGIASLLLPGGRTAHSQFKIPFKLYDNSTCTVNKKSDLAELICKADLIIWDEAPMINKHALEALERTVTDIMTKDDTVSPKPIFGGKTLLLGGDFRQILPVIQKGSREMIVDSSISRSKLWKHFKIFKLSTNMRLMNADSDDAQQQEIADFGKWVLDVGDGKIPISETKDDSTWIQIPDDLLVKCDNGDYINTIVESTYPSLLERYVDYRSLEERCILAPTNESADQINEHMISLIPGEDHVFRSADSISPETSDFQSKEVFYTNEFLNSLTFSGFPNHEIYLKVGIPIMLLRNLKQSEGLCNGTRLIVTQIAGKVIQAEILTGKGRGKRVFIHRVVLEPSNTGLPIILRRRQFPIKVCFAMTINKSQCQSLPIVGIYLEKPVFSHGQLYVAVSRTTSRQGLKILIKRGEDDPEGYTQNIVYKEIFSNLS